MRKIVSLLTFMLLISIVSWSQGKVSGTIKDQNGDLIPFATVNITVDPGTNLCSLSSSVVSLDAYDPAKNYYDPAAKTFYLDFGYSGGTRHVTMTAVYDRPR